MTDESPSRLESASEASPLGALQAAEAEALYPTSDALRFAYLAGRATEAARYRGVLEAAAGAANWLETYGRTESEAALSSSLRAALAENPAPAARYRDEAMVERVAEAIWGATTHGSSETWAWVTGPHVSAHYAEGFRKQARAALAVIAEDAAG